MSKEGTTWRKQGPASVSGVYKLTDQEKVYLGLKKPEPLKHLIHIVIPVHHTARAVVWESRFVSAASLPGWIKQYPNLEFVRDGGWW